jgi:hypothetical protein
LFKQVVDIIRQVEYLTPKELQQIVNVRASINKGLSDELNTVFPDTVPVSRPVISNQEIKDPYWLSGFTDAEGTFFIESTRSKLYKQGMQISLKFSISQHSRDEELMRSIVDYLGCGNYYLRSGKCAVAPYIRPPAKSGTTETNVVKATSLSSKQKAVHLA